MIKFYCQFKILLQPNHNKVWEIINCISEIRENKIVSLKSWESYNQCHNDEIGSTKQ